VSPGKVFQKQGRLEWWTEYALAKKWKSLIGMGCWFNWVNLLFSIGIEIFKLNHAYASTLFKVRTHLAHLTPHHLPTHHLFHALLDKSFRHDI
jgi:hypothetical protein